MGSKAGSQGNGVWLSRSLPEGPYLWRLHGGEVVDHLSVMTHWESEC